MRPSSTMSVPGLLARLFALGSLLDSLLVTLLDNHPFLLEELSKDLFLGHRCNFQRPLCEVPYGDHWHVVATSTSGRDKAFITLLFEMKLS